MHMCMHMHMYRSCANVLALLLLAGVEGSGDAPELATSKASRATSSGTGTGMTGTSPPRCGRDEPAFDTRSTGS